MIKKIVMLISILPLLSFTDISFNASKSIAAANVQLVLVAGYSPSIFDKGWVFGLNGKNNLESKDITDEIIVTGTFSNLKRTGNFIYPVFDKLGPNELILSYKKGDIVTQRVFTLDVVNSDNYAAVGDLAKCQEDNHGCKECPHTVQGPIITGSPTVDIRERPAARKGDIGVHSSCCGPNTFTIIEGDPKVLIDGIPAARLKDKTQHCGGIGMIIELKE